jgi:cytoskeletal protein CcmA (bactofilin family)
MGTYYDSAAPLEHRMNEKRRLIDQIGESPTFVAEGVRLTGDLETSGPLVVCGSIRGDGRVGGTLRMSVTAQWEGEIHTGAAVVAGRITGRLVVEGKLEVAATAVIRADINARDRRGQGSGHRRRARVTSGEPIVGSRKARAPGRVGSGRTPPAGRLAGYILVRASCAHPSDGRPVS